MLSYAFSSTVIMAFLSIAIGYSLVFIFMNWLG